MLHDRALRRALQSFSIAVLVLGPLGACGGSADDAAADKPDSPATAVGGDNVPKECADAYPLAMKKVELADVKNVPADWPEPPVEATLCETSSTMDDSVGIASYATKANAAAVLDAYEDALSGYEIVRDDTGGLGEEILATKGSAAVEITVQREGTFALLFAAP